MRRSSTPVRCTCTSSRRPGRRRSTLPSSSTAPVARRSPCSRATSTGSVAPGRCPARRTRRRGRPRSIACGHSRRASRGSAATRGSRLDVAAAADDAAAMTEPTGQTVDGTPWEEPRPPHLPDRVMRVHPIAWLFVALAVVVVVADLPTLRSMAVDPWFSGTGAPRPGRARRRMPARGGPVLAPSGRHRAAAAASSSVPS